MTIQPSESHFAAPRSPSISLHAMPSNANTNTAKNMPISSQLPCTGMTERFSMDICNGSPPNTSRICDSLSCSWACKRAVSSPCWMAMAVRRRTSEHRTDFISVRTSRTLPRIGVNSSGPEMAIS